MSITLIGKKIGMTQVYDSKNCLIPVTVIEAGPCPVVQVKTQASDGYEAVQIGYGAAREKIVSKPVRGHLAKNGVDPVKTLREFRTEKVEREFAVGEILKCTEFEEGTKVDVIGTTKGHGFQGVMKRWGFHGQRQTHGSMMHRRPGSIGHCQWPGEVAKGKKLPGHMGVRRRTTQNLKVVRVLEDKNLILVKGSVHGPNDGLVLIRKAIKKKKSELAKK